MALTLDIVTPERRVLSVSCDEVRAPGAQGGFGVRQNHEPFMTSLEPGRLTYVEGGREHHYALGGGFLQVADNRVIVLADSAAQSLPFDQAWTNTGLITANDDWSGVIYLYDLNYRGPFIIQNNRFSPQQVFDIHILDL